MPKRTFNPRVETRLTRDAFQKLDEVAKERDRSKSDVVREAVLWYLEHYEALKEDKRQSELTQSLNAMTNRICGMLARQGAEIGTLYELAWQNHVDNKIEQRFTQAANTVKSNMRKRLTDDERRVAESMKRVVEK